MFHKTTLTGVGDFGDLVALEAVPALVAPGIDKLQEVSR